MPPPTIPLSSGAPVRGLQRYDAHRPLGPIDPPGPDELRFGFRGQLGHPNDGEGLFHVPDRGPDDAWRGLHLGPDDGGPGPLALNR